ncbi:MAG: hypothetical protein AAFR52_11305 [Pseudomonadota bacterium]
MRDSRQQRGGGLADPAPALRAEPVTAGELAIALGRTESTIRKHAAAGRLTVVDRNGPRGAARFDLETARREYAEIVPEAIHGGERHGAGRPPASLGGEGPSGGPVADGGGGNASAGGPDERAYRDNRAAASELNVERLREDIKRRQLENRKRAGELVDRAQVERELARSMRAIAARVDAAAEPLEAAIVEIVLASLAPARELARHVGSLSGVDEKTAEAAEIAAEPPADLRAVARDTARRLLRELRERIAGGGDDHAEPGRAA